MLRRVILLYEEQEERCFNVVSKMRDGSVILDQKKWNFNFIFYVIFKVVFFFFLLTLSKIVIKKKPTTLL